MKHLRSFGQTWIKGMTVACLTVGVAMGVLGQGMPARAQEAAAINVEHHTEKEVRSFIAENPVKDLVTDYDIEPVVTNPYVAGKLKKAIMEDALTMLKHVRYIAGLSTDIELDDSYSELAQTAVMINAANDTLSHSPKQPEGMDDSMYDLGKQGAGKSNLAKGYPTLARAVLNAWTEDGDNLEVLGYRRWVLNPTMEKVGFGDATKGESPWDPHYQAMYAIDNSFVRNGQVSIWPGENTPIEYFDAASAWSYSSGATESMENVKVTLVNESQDKTWSFDKDSADGVFHVDNSYIGLPGCVIFKPQDLATYQAGDDYVVTITGLSKGDVTYRVHFFSLNEALKYQVSFDANGAEGIMESVSVEDDKDYQIPQNDFKAPKYMYFSHWEVGEASYQAGDSLKITENIVLKAIWKEKELQEGELKIVPETFPDEAFCKYVSENCDKDEDGILSLEEIAGTKSIVLEGKPDELNEVVKLDGIEVFTELTELKCRYGSLEQLDISKNDKLEVLDLQSNGHIKSLDLSGNLALKSLNCSNMPALTEIDISECPILAAIHVGGTKQLHASEEDNPNYEHVICFQNENGVLEFDDTLKVINREAEIKIDEATFPDETFRNLVMIFDKDESGSLNEDEINAVTEINCAGTFSQKGGVKSLQGIECFANLTKLYCAYNELTELDLSKNSKLVVLDCRLNQLTKLNLDENPELTELVCNGNKLTELKAGEKEKLKKLICAENDITSLELDGSTELEVLECYFNQLSTLNLSNCPKLVAIAKIEYGNVTAWSSKVVEYSFEGAKLVVDANMKMILDPTLLEINEKSFPDEVFRDYVKKKLDKDQDGLLNTEEIDAVVNLDVAGKADKIGEIKSLKGIEFFKNLKTLNCQYNQLTQLNLEANKELTTLNCGFNELTELDVRENTALKDFSCNSNKLVALDVTKNEELVYLNCAANQLSSLTFGNLRRLGELTCYNNKLTEMDLGGLSGLKNFYCSANKLTKLTLKGNVCMETLWCANNELESLDLEETPYLTTLLCSGNKIKKLDITHAERIDEMVRTGKKTVYAYNPNAWEYTLNGASFSVDKAVELIASAPLVKKGDANGDGNVNRADRIHLARALAKWEGYELPSKEVADFDGNGTVNRADRIYLARALAGWSGYEVK